MIFIFHLPKSKEVNSLLNPYKHIPNLRIYLHESLKFFLNIKDISFGSIQIRNLIIWIFERWYITLMGERFMGGCTPFMIFFYFVLQDTNKIFCSVIKIISGIIFQISGRWFSWQAKGGVHPPHKCKGVFRQIGHGK